MRRHASGSVFGGAVGADLGRRWAVGVGYERLAGSVRTLSPYGYYQFDLPADLVRGFARFETGGRGRVRHFVEAGAGGLWSAGKYFQVPGPLFPPQPRYTCRGSGPVLDAGLGLRVAATRSVGSEVFAGYRYAVIGRMTGSTTTESFTFRRADQENMRFDYSGLFARAALTLRFGTADDPGR
jgi:hypothetical protein